MGDCDVPFALQSLSKVFVYGLALEDHGRNDVLQRLGVEPSRDAFNSISLMSAITGRITPWSRPGRW